MSGWRVEIRKRGTLPWASGGAEAYLTTELAWHNARQWKEMGFDVQVLRNGPRGVEYAAEPLPKVTCPVCGEQMENDPGAYYHRKDCERRAALARGDQAAADRAAYVGD